MNTPTMQTVGADTTASMGREAAGQSAASVRAFVWRLHFYVGIFVAPLLVLSALSGILYVFFPQVEEVMYARLYAVTPQVGRPALDYDAQVAAVKEAYPSAQVRVFSPSFAATRSSAVTVVFEKEGANSQDSSGGISSSMSESQHSDHGEHSGQVAVPKPVQSQGKKPQARSGAGGTLTTFYLHPQTGDVTGTLVEESRYRTVIQRAHKTFLAGNVGRTLAELGTSWLMVLLLTGFYLWFPRKAGQKDGVWFPRLSGASRLRWRDFHSILGAYSLLGTFVLAFTGITWTQYAGNYRRSFQKAIGQESVFRITPPPSTLVAGGVPVSLNTVAKVAEEAGATPPYRITLPQGADGSFGVQTYDDAPFQEALTVFVDQYSGRVLKIKGRGDTPPVARFFGMGVALHKGSLFGLANQILCALGAGMIIFSVVSGLVMWQKRRPTGGFGAPRPLPGSRVPLPLLLAFAVLGIVLPTVGVSFALVLVFDRFILPYFLRRSEDCS